MTVPRLVLSRLALLPLSLLILVTLTFGLVALLPGDPARAVAGNLATPEQVAAISAQLGLDQSFAERYVDYVGGVLHGDLGNSFFTGNSVTSELARRMPATIELVAAGLIIASLIGLVLGTLGAYFQRTRLDTAARGGITLMQSIPDFLMGLMLVYVLFYLTGVAPAPVGQLAITDSRVDRVTGFLVIDTLLRGDTQQFWSHLHHLMLPALALGLVYSAFFGKVARSVMATSLNSAQVEFARALGLSERQVIRYAFLQARTPILTYGAILFGTLVGGAAIIETVFSWQGAGQWALEGVLSLDVPVIQGFILVAGALTIVIYLLLDVLVVLLDPRVRHQS